MPGGGELRHMLKGMRQREAAEAGGENEKRPAFAERLYLFLMPLASERMPRLAFTSVGY